MEPKYLKHGEIVFNGFEVPKKVEYVIYKACNVYKLRLCGQVWGKVIQPHLYAKNTLPFPFRNFSRSFNKKIELYVWNNDEGYCSDSYGTININNDFIIITPTTRPFKQYLDGHDEWGKEYTQGWVGEITVGGILKCTPRHMNIKPELIPLDELGIEKILGIIT